MTLIIVTIITLIKRIVVSKICLWLLSLKKNQLFLGEYGLHAVGLSATQVNSFAKNLKVQLMSLRPPPLTQKLELWHKSAAQAKGFQIKVYSIFICPHSWERLKILDDKCHLANILMFCSSANMSQQFWSNQKTFRQREHSLQSKVQKDQCISLESLYVNPGSQSWMLQKCHIFLRLSPLPLAIIFQVLPVIELAIF